MLDFIVIVPIANEVNATLRLVFYDEVLFDTWLCFDRGVFEFDTVDEVSDTNDAAETVRYLQVYCHSF